MATRARKLGEDDPSPAGEVAELELIQTVAIFGGSQHSESVRQCTGLSLWVYRYFVRPINFRSCDLAVY